MKPLRCAMFVAAILTLSHLQPVLADEHEYVPPDDVVQKMTPREARRELRTLGRVGVGWNGDSQFIADTVEAGPWQLRIRSNSGGWFNLSFEHAKPRVVKETRAFKREVHIYLGPTSDSHRNQYIYYSTWGMFDGRAQRLADALVVLRHHFASQIGPKADAAFEEVVKQFRAAHPKPQLSEELRKYNVQASAAVRDKDLLDAADLFGEVVRLAPWYPEGHFNYALVLGEIDEVWMAAREMKRYLALVPDASNARAAQDKIYEWERQITK